MSDTGLNFADRNAVEQFLETKRFRPCANLKCFAAHLQHETLYLPVCLEARFNRKGAAQYIEIAQPPRALSPLTYTSVAAWGPLLSCPRKCKGYRNRTVAKILTAAGRAASWLFEHTLKPAEFFWAAFWAWLMKYVGLG
jgi:hypothetical protein